MNYLKISFFTILVFFSVVQSQEIKPDVEYQGETTLKSTEYGVSFLLPAGWSGIYPNNSDFFVMKSQAFEGYIFVATDEMTLIEARQIMNTSVELGNGIVFQPKGKVQTNGSQLEAEYKVAGSQNPLSGIIKTVIGKYGWGISFIAASTPKNINKLKNVLSKIETSLKLTDPKQGKPSVQSGSSNSWFEHLNNRKLSHFYTASGYTEEDYIWLCGNGYFYKSFNSGGFGGGASGAFQSKNGGRWSVSGNMQQGTLLLSYNDGSTARYSLTHQGTKLFLDGKRYFRETANCE